jgi:2-polyprenyl-6-hydroxyphenyl methylase/3-demethylubiquinone-9 3-methyltransferase
VLFAPCGLPARRPDCEESAVTNLLEAETHFAFGENWQSFAKLLDDRRIIEAETGMRRLFPEGELRGAKFLDIGCGSGLSSLAAARLGAAEIEGVDIDANSVAATQETLARYAPSCRRHVSVRSVFDFEREPGARFDVVYSWGVLHHTGDMWRAIRIAASLVKPGGHLAIAIYRKTPLCGFWTREKTFYSKAPGPVQAAIRAVYKSVLALREWRHGRKLSTLVQEYHSSRGMDWSHDVHDWLGGYPYESASAESIRSFLGGQGLDVIREFSEPPGNGITGSGCDEFVAVRRAL